MPPESLSAAEAARLLNVSEATVRRWIRQGLFRWPGAGGRAVDREELLRWARAHGITPGVEHPTRPAEPADLLADAVERGAVTRGAPDSAALAIELVVGAVPGLDDEARARLLAEVLERERAASTGLGRGVALPHPRRPPADIVREPVVTLAFLEQPVDWAAVDGQPVSVVVLPLSPTAQTHLQLLARIAFVLRLESFRKFLDKRPSRDELVRALRSIRKDS